MIAPGNPASKSSPHVYQLVCSGPSVGPTSARLGRLQKFDPVPERIGNVNPSKPFERFIRGWCMPCGSTSIGEVGKTSNQERRVGFRRRTKVGVHAEMEPQRPAAEPDAAALCQIGRLRFFDETEHACIEGPCLGFLTRWHGQLHVIEPDDFSHWE